MFALLSRPIARRSVGYAARCVSQIPPAPPKPPQTDAQGQPQPTSSSFPSLDILPTEEQEEPRRTGARSRDSVTSAEAQRKQVGRISAALLAVLFGFNVAYMSRDWSEDELKDKRLTSENAPSTRWGRTKARFKYMLGYFSEPAWPELLPPPYPAPHQKPYTLIVSVDDLLVTSIWDRQHGWRTAKRPGVDYFLAYISQFYEVVIFTTQHLYTAAPILDKLDKYGFFISHRLHREATRSLNGHVVKDLSYLNRDLSKVVVLDTNPEHVSTHPENAIILSKWDGSQGDRGLVAMIPFLESIAIYKPTDVRPIITAYQGKDIPLEYAKKEADGKQRHIEEWKKKKQASPNPFAAMFGLGSQTEPVPLTYLEQKRKEAQRNYLEEQAYIEKNREQLDKLLEQDREMMAAQVPSNLWDAIDQMKGGPPKPEEGKEEKGKEVQSPAPSAK
ncbi:import inner membrane translocase subunit tim-50 [Armillaria borealis]|uniref:Mitochondrial import inner membrane translocase subunit TIM50 n=1 Tax=Armillaria borealis TaxID=47425 RepID=A0AA39MW62_9AGAR|nr:import inner membrane translocase subunit tim-50 [Armillaria borealis]